MGATHLFRLKHFLKYLVKAKSRYNIHSPFLYRFVEEVLRDKKRYQAYEQVNRFRKQLKSDKTWFKKFDRGAGQFNGSSLKQVSKEADRITFPSKYGALFYRLIRHYSLRNSLELGTGLGVGTAYLMKGMEEIPNSHLTTIEGCPETQRIAKQYIQSLDNGNNKPPVTFIEGDIHEKLPQALSDFQSVDLVVMDGNHQKDSVLDAFEQILPEMSDNGVIVVDDIYWSPGMYEAWQTMVQSKGVTLSIDFFRLGLLFTNPALAHQYLYLKY